MSTINVAEKLRGINVAEKLRGIIITQGPIPVATYMAHAATAYYARGNAFGAKGDFITAPEISQIFGELIGLWAAMVWQQMGSPNPVRLIELGPGRGTLLADFLRAVTIVPDFATAIEVHLVETSPALRSTQAEALRPRTPSWHDSLTTVPEGPSLVIANEFFDALPIRQLVRTDDGWRERMVDLVDDVFTFAMGPLVLEPPLAPDVLTSPIGTIAEHCPEARTLAATLGLRLASEGGAALLIDYGPAHSTAGESLQAVQHHAFHSPLETPGEADITAHVDFQALAEAATMAGARHHGPVAQGEWLSRLGIGVRAHRLAATAPIGQAAEIMGAARRLIDPAEMGTLFKVLALAHPRLVSLPGFDS